MSKKDEVSYTAFWVLGIAWMIVGVLQTLGGDEVVGMLDMVVAVGHLILARSYTK